jgi:hypothetical protein
MPLTLLEAKTALSPYVDNGVCSTDSRVVARINEAQRRLHSVRAWLGVLARYSVAVTNGQFTLPASTGDITTISGFGLESATRVASTTAAAGFLTNGVQAFLTDTGDVLPLNFVPTSSDFRTYAIEGSSPARVEVTGKLNYVPAISDNNLLIIDDIDALKLMILALYREENNQFEMAQALENKAIERLTVKTDRAIEAARRVNYQTKKASTIPNSLGDMRAKLALDLMDGLRVSDAELVDLINNAEEALFARGCWYGTVDSCKIGVTNTNEIHLPSIVGTVLAVDMANKPVSLFDRRYDFHENGPGYQEKGTSGYDTLVDRGEAFVAGEWRRKYFLRSGYAPECIHILYKKRWKAKHRDHDKMDIRNYPAIKEMVVALREKEPEKAAFYESKAVALLQKELAEMRGGARSQLQIQGPAFSAGQITALV